MKSVGFLKEDCDLGQKGKIVHVYNGSPQPENYGRASACIHMIIPEGIDERALIVSFNEETGEPEITQDAQKLADIVQAEEYAQATAVLDSAINFGQGMIKEITLENMMLGIPQDGKTGEVRKALAEVLTALQTGSLYDAIVELKAIPEIAKDAKYITDARLLSAVNKIETYLGQPLSETL